jgi:D-glycero-D-manno-heptose 1,7-bisphosphate phosphatase
MSDARRIVFLDRDGTVACYREYCLRAEDFRLLPGAAAAIRLLNDAGVLVALVTNQSAVGRGWLTPAGLEAIHDKMRRGLARQGARLDAIAVCPHHPQAGCDCRKPGCGLLRQAAQALNASLAGAYMVGDRWLDVRCGRAAGCTTVLVHSGHAPEPADGLVADLEAPDLRTAARWILAREAGLAAAADAAHSVARGW